METIEITSKRGMFRLKYLIPLAGLVIFGFACSIFENILGTLNSLINHHIPTAYEYGMTDYDQWLDFAAVIKYAILNNGAGISALTSYLHQHNFTPLFPTCVAIIDFIFNNLMNSELVLNGILDIGTLFVLRKICIDLYHFQEKDAMIVLILYQSNYVIMNNALVGNEAMPFVAFCVSLAFLINVKFVNNVNFENGMKLFLVNTLVLFCREIIWPILLLGPGFILINILVKRDNVKLRSVAFMKKLLIAIDFAIILPLICYLLFFFSFPNTLPSILIQVNSLIAWGTTRTVSGFFISILPAFCFMPVLILYDIKGIYKKKESLPFLLWIVIFSSALLIIPGPFWIVFWEPEIFCFCVLFLQSVREGRVKKKGNLILSISIATNLLCTLVAFIILHLALIGAIPF